ncbi:MAG: hypothetical protein ABSC23_03745 [Bryobacteraceae bacterium]|jgi:hypothetical protein
MAARVQQLILGLGKGKQASISAAGSTFLRFKKINADLTTPRPIFENDAAEIGKGHEFITQTFPSHYEVANKLEKYASAEFVTWAAAYGLGNVAVVGSSAPYSYTITPIDPGTTLELPYFSVVEQVAEGGASAVDNMLVGCAVEDFLYQFSYGPGRTSSKMTVNWVGSGLLTTPSGITVPALTTENNMLAASMALTVNGVDYVATKRILSGSVGWKNNLLLNAGFFPGSGLQNGLQVRGRMEIGARVPSFQFMARLLHGSTEYNTLVAQTTGTAVLNVQHDSGNQVTFTFQKMAFQVAENGEGDGIVAVTVTGAPQYDATLGVLTVTTQCGIGGIAQ